MATTKHSSSILAAISLLLFLGQSGVGKSSLINQLIPELNLRVNEISTKSKLGKHNVAQWRLPSTVHQYWQQSVCLNALNYCHAQARQ
jgi:putative ribosome biogenesis GTPase RsgA